MSEQDDAYFDISASTFNILSAFKDYPDETLQMLKIATDYCLNPEQTTIAKTSALELTNAKEITMLDLVEFWEATPALSEFAANLRKVFLPL